MPEGIVKIFDSKEKLFKESANFIIGLINDYIKSKGKCTFVLSGGSTPKSLYEELALKKINWDKVYFFWGDERCVPPDDDESNYKMAYESFLSKININSNNVIRIISEMPHEQAAFDYEKRLRYFFPDENFPSFDIVLLGLGEDGHTASLFPGSEALAEKEKWVMYNYVEKFKKWRVTLTLPVLNNSKNIIFLVSGKEKANIVKKVLKDKDKSLPASYISPYNGTLNWYVDKDAVSLLD